MNYFAYNLLLDLLDDSINIKFLSLLLNLREKKTFYD